MPDRKINFYSKFAVKLFHVTVANADIGSLKSLRTFHEKMCVPHASEFEQNRMVQTTRKFELLDKKKQSVLKPFLTNR